MHTHDLAAKFDQLLTTTRESYDKFIELTKEALRAERPTLLAIDETTIQEEQLQMDLALVRAAPVAIVPMHCEFAPLAETGHRFLAARDGLYLEVRRPWLHLIRKLADQSAVSMPYGEIQPKVEVAFGGMASALPLLREFAAQARQHLPRETAASLTWKPATSEWALRIPEVIGEATAARISYHQVELAEDECLVIDMHSHGTLPAGFSATDNEDDRGTVKFAGVFGNIDTDRPTAAFRLCVLGLFIPIPVPAEQIFGTH